MVVRWCSLTSACGAAPDHCCWSQDQEAAACGTEERQLTLSESITIIIVVT